MVRMDLFRTKLSTLLILSVPPLCLALLRSLRDLPSLQVHFVVDLYSEDERHFEHDLHEMMAKSGGGANKAGKPLTVQNICGAFPN